MGDARATYACARARRAAHAQSCHLNNAESSQRINGRRDDAVKPHEVTGSFQGRLSKGSHLWGVVVSSGNAGIKCVTSAAQLSKLTEPQAQNETWQSSLDSQGLYVPSTKGTGSVFFFVVFAFFYPSLCSVTCSTS